MFKQQKGITLLNLVFVILFLLALAAVAIALALDEFKYDPKPEQIVTEQSAEPTDNSNSETSENSSLIIDGEELVNELLDNE